MDEDFKEDVVSISEEECQSLTDLWNENAIQSVFEKRNEYYGVSDSTEHFFKKIDRVVSQEYEPDDNDILLVRYHATGLYRIHCDTCILRIFIKQNCHTFWGGYIFCGVVIFCHCIVCA